MSNYSVISPPYWAFRHRGRFMVGQDSAGRWIASDERNLAGGVFADRAAALRYALAECDYDPREVFDVPMGMLSLDRLFDRERTATVSPGASGRKTVL